MDEVPGPPRKLPRIFIQEQDDELKEFFLIVYQVGRSTVTPRPLIFCKITVVAS